MFIKFDFIMQVCWDSTRPYLQIQQWIGIYVICLRITRFEQLLNSNGSFVLVKLELWLLTNKWDKSIHIHRHLFYKCQCLLH